ncbi:hypothetical protein F5888DRAFT_1122372 [Russula emetica]|nr:hypothetical protein F5888DRAFT_1122372 [Russula emetica]
MQFGFQLFHFRFLGPCALFFCFASVCCSSTQTTLCQPEPPSLSCYSVHICDFLGNPVVHNPHPRHQKSRRQKRGTLPKRIQHGAYC